MMELNERYITDADGKRQAVVLDIETFERLLERLEDLEDIVEADAVKRAIAKGEEELIPWEQVKAELEARWAAQET